MKKLSKDLGFKIKKIRKSLGMTQRQLADMVNYSQTSTITKIENGFINISNNKVHEIAKALGVNISDLLEDNNPKIHDDPYFIDTRFLNSEEQKELKSLIDMNIIMFMKNGGLSEADEKALKLAITKAFLKARKKYNKK
ncbi:helix-turn-helix domain-containing protein [uncultured Sneathia sp.]|uniref:helix-turn-helix domain-containing protein n=1 Tax=uncultured Sneathia sp. TaxID=278067 RepID=UPI0025973488|nr:helix-turn-helix domain-containing protein [uncultured Sneathia sp.]